MGYKWEIEHVTTQRHESPSDVVDVWIPPKFPHPQAAPDHTLASPPTNAPAGGTGSRTGKFSLAHRDFPATALTQRTRLALLKAECSRPKVSRESAVSLAPTIPGRGLGPQPRPPNPLTQQTLRTS
jgi:hypothetical protein